MPLPLTLITIIPTNKNIYKNYNIIQLSTTQIIPEIKLI